MARYKLVYMSPRLLPVELVSQLISGSFAHAVHHLVDALDLSGFDAHHRNDLTPMSKRFLARQEKITQKLRENRPVPTRADFREALG